MDKSRAEVPGIHGCLNKPLEAQVLLGLAERLFKESRAEVMQVG